MRYTRSKFWLTAILLFLIMIKAKSQEKTYSYLALGDSYTIGESVDASMRWPVQLVNQVNRQGHGFSIEQPEIIATTGWTTQELRKAIAERKPKKDYDLVSLLIGVNNQYRGYPLEDYPTEFRSLLETAIEHAAGDASRVFVVSIPDYAFTPFGASKREEITKGIDEYNEINKRISEELDVRYFNITPISRKGLDDKALVANDKLHPSAIQYSQWVELILSNDIFIDLLK